jgi:glyoxylase I family protein
MTVKNVLAGIAVTNLDEAEVWYDTLFNRAPDTRPMDELVEWQFSGGGWLQLFVSQERAGKSSITLVVEDFQGHLENLNKLGIKILAVTQGDKVKTCIVQDPDGNQIVFAQGFDANHRSVM